METVADRGGQIILEPGEPLTSEHLTTLRAWGIADVLVEADRSQASSSEPGAHNVHARFVRNDTEFPAIAVLLEICNTQIQNEEKAA